MIEDKQATEITNQELVARALAEVRAIASELKEARDSERAVELSTQLQKKVAELRELVNAARAGMTTASLV